MTYNSEIIILNSTPERGSVTGKRMRLTGTEGKLYAKTIDKIYKFARWETQSGQVISTSNPLVITDWQHQIIRVVFEDVMLSDQMFIDNDAISTQTWMIEAAGIPRLKGGLVEGANQTTVYSQKNIAGPATRTTSWGAVNQTYERTYGFRDSTATWDPDDTTASTGWWLVKPNVGFTPASGVAAAEYHPQMDAKFKRKAPYRLFVSPAGGGLYHGSTTKDGASNGSIPVYGYYSNPTTGTSTLYPMWNWSPTSTIYTNGYAEHADLTGLEGSRVTFINAANAYSPNSYNNVVNMDATAYMDQLRYLLASNSAGLVPGRRSNTACTYETCAPRAEVGGNVTTSWENPHERPVQLQYATGTHTSPRLLEPLGYTNLQVMSLRSQYYFRSAYNWSGPMDTLMDPVTKKDRDNPHWVKKHQHTPHSGSLLWSLRYTPMEDMRFGPTARISNYSAFGHYYKNLKHIAWSQPNWDNDGSSLESQWAPQAFSNMRGLKSLMSLVWYENYDHLSFDSSVPFDWSGLKYATNLRSLYISHGSDKYVKHLNLSDIPASVVDLYLSPSAYLVEDIFPGETVTFKLNMQQSVSNTVSDSSRYSVGTEVTANNISIISTETPF